MDMLYTLMPLVLLIVVMYFLMIRPQKKKERQVTDMRNSLKVGDEVVTIGGIHGVISKVREDYLTIQVGADKTKLEVTRWSISQKVNSDPNKARPVPKKTQEDEAEDTKAPKRPKKLEKATVNTEDVEAAGKEVTTKSVETDTDTMSADAPDTKKE